MKVQEAQIDSKGTTERKPGVSALTQMLKAYNTDKVRHMRNDKVDYILESLR